MALGRVHDFLDDSTKAAGIPLVSGLSTPTREAREGEGSDYRQTTPAFKKDRADWQLIRDGRARGGCAVK